MSSPSQLVSECCFEHLCFEIIRSFDHLDQDAALEKLDAIGFQIGFRFTERIAIDRQRFVTVSDVVKFVCKEVWNHVFRKQVDKLQTDGKGVYVVHDHNFKWVTRVSPEQDTDQGDEIAARKFLLFPCGILRGALTNLGIPCSVTPEVHKLPYCVFYLKITD